MRFTPSVATPDLWHYLASADRAGRPIVMYGMGNGADKIIAVCDRFGITVRDFFASDGFVRGHSFHGKVVLSFSEICAKYGTDELIVLLSFASSRPEVLELFDRVGAVCEMYAPDVPVCGDNLFCADFHEAHRSDFDAARALFADEESRRVYDGIITYKLSGRIDVLRSTESNAADAYRDILHAERFETVMDLGAYNGDSIRALRTYAPTLARVIAMEPDRRNARKLAEYAERAAEETPPLEVTPIEAGAWSEEGVLYFDASGNRNANLTPNAVLHGATARMTEVKVNAPDAVALATWGERCVDHIKYDVEGAEAEALRGSRRLIERDRPALLVSAYHRSEDLFALPLLVHELCPSYRLYLRRMAGVPAWDINLYAVAE